jgi:hypothetical protein
VQVRQCLQLCASRYIYSKFSLQIDPTRNPNRNHSSSLDYVQFSVFSTSHLRKSATTLVRKLSNTNANVAPLDVKYKNGRPLDAVRPKFIFVPQFHLRCSRMELVTVNLMTPWLTKRFIHYINGG